MQPLAIRIIRAEHDALGAMLRTLPLVLAAQRRAGVLPDFSALRAMLFYIDEFPERLHHPKESEILFPKLRARAPELRQVLDELDHDHAMGERAVRELQHSLLAFEQMGAGRRDKFDRQLELYCARYLHHMQREEQEILPIALRVLKDADWADLDEAFATNADPLAGHADPAGPYAELRQRILSALPAPLGLGPPLA